MTYVENIKRMPREVWILCLAILVNRTGSMVLPFMALYLTKYRDLTVVQAGTVLMVYGLSALVASPILGRLTDRLGTYRMMNASLYLTGLVLLVCPFVSGFGPILAITALLAVANEGFRPASMAAVSELVPAEDRKPAFAFIRLAINLGMSIGPALGGFLIVFSFRSLFWIDGLTSLLAGIMLTLAPWPTKTPAPAETSARPHPLALFKISIDRTFAFFLLAVVPVGIVFFQHESAMPLYMVRELHMPEFYFGMMFTLNTVLIVFLEVPLNLAMVNWDHRRTMALGSMCYAVGFGAMLFAHNVWSLVVTVIIWTFGEMVLFPTLSAYVAEIAPAAQRGSYMGLYMMAFNLSFAVGPWLGNVVLERFGSHILWPSTFVVATISALMFLRMKPSAQSETQAVLAVEEPQEAT
ncbi:MAG: MFS transporter [Blastocatellia bacterium]|nr:MFS transporter [Blastocatellia bacterium]